MRTVTINRAAEIKGVSQQAIRAAIESGKLETVEVQIPDTQITLVSLNRYQPNPNMKRAGRKPSNGARNPRPEPRVFCGQCGCSLTSTDINEAKRCTNCGNGDIK